MRYSTPSWPSWRSVKLVGLGGTSFWLPDALWHAMRGSRFGGGDVLVITGLLPLTLLAMYLFLKRRRGNEVQSNVGPLLMLGVWTLGGFFISVGGFLGGGYGGRSDAFHSFLYTTLIGFVPPFTYILATYDASLGALILASLAAVLFVVRTHYTRPKHPPTPDEPDFR